MLLSIILIMLPIKAGAQESGGKFQLGFASALIIGKINLSDLDKSFDDLEFDGLNGLHISGVFFLYRIRPYLRVGFETLAASSDKD
ncbi:MAG: hypothetical protein JSW20_08280 [Nitrospiraceae bacterium]|nr:MAG: hypothetical protein JSW20_08280 [Nitrospiraceae bacterium]